MLTGFDSPSSAFWIFLIFFAAIVIRYFIAAGIFYWYFYTFDFKRWELRKINKTKFPDQDQLLFEMKWSIVTSLIFAGVGVLTYYLFEKGYTAIYLNLEQKDIFYMPLSLLLALLIHETYYYWVHRWMHNPKIFRQVHKVHHDSIVTSPWTAFSFHPWEGLLEAIIIPIILIIIPMHPYVLLFYLILMTVSSIVNHLDIEIYPKGFKDHWIGKWLIGATHHHYHHKEFRTNYGLYFTFWDRWMKTESKAYKEKET